jgi:hypothetical protein
VRRSLRERPAQNDTSAAQFLLPEPNWANEVAGLLFWIWTAWKIIFFSLPSMSSSPTRWSSSPPSASIENVAGIALTSNWVAKAKEQVVSPIDLPPRENVGVRVLATDSSCYSNLWEQLAIRC